jgi:hypothetical protein
MWSVWQGDLDFFQQTDAGSTPGKVKVFLLWDLELRLRENAVLIAFDRQYQKKRRIFYIILNFGAEHSQPIEKISLFLGTLIVFHLIANVSKLSI